MRRGQARFGVVILTLAMTMGCGQVGQFQQAAATLPHDLAARSTSLAPGAQPASNGVNGSKSPQALTPGASRAASVASTTRVKAEKLSATKLPRSFPRYSLVVSTVGRLLAQLSHIPVYLPKSYPAMRYLDVQYALKDGYRLTLSAGPALPANSPKIQYGYAEFLFSVQGLPWSATYHENYVPLNPALPSRRHGIIRLAPGIVGTSYPDPPPFSDNQPALIRWHEDGWTLTVYGGGSASVGTAKQLAKSLRGAKLPGTHGQAIFAVGTHVPSLVTYELKGVRYVIEGTSDEPVSLAEHMEKVQP
ncbi:MAG: hypothetical protein OWU84_10295 [Firmicutes bacterium]|nr:hypothetical protein [Bacillota bacterium]